MRRSARNSAEIDFTPVSPLSTHVQALGERVAVSGKCLETVWTSLEGSTSIGDLVLEPHSLGTGHIHHYAPILGYFLCYFFVSLLWLMGMTSVYAFYSSFMVSVLYVTLMAHFTIVFFVPS